MSLISFLVMIYFLFEYKDDTLIQIKISFLKIKPQSIRASYLSKVIPLWIERGLYSKCNYFSY